MDNLEVSKILRAYSITAMGARNKEELKEVIKTLKSELDLRKIDDFIEV